MPSLAGAEAEEANIDAGHTRLRELQSSVSGKKRKRGDGYSFQSKIDNKNDASRRLFECADRMKDSVVVLRKCLNVLSDPNAAQHCKHDAMGRLESSILPLLDTGSKVFRMGFHAR